MSARTIIGNAKSHSKKRQNRTRVMRNHFKSTVHAIYVDEAQDMDKDFFVIISIIINLGIEVYTVGDPIQAINKTGEYEKFIDEFKIFINIISGQCQSSIPKTDISICLN